MRAEQIGFVGGIPLWEPFVGFDCVANFLNLPKGRDYRLAVEDGGDLFFGERVAFDRQRSLNRADAIDPPQAQIRPDRPLSARNIVGGACGLPQSWAFGKGLYGLAPSQPFHSRAANGLRMTTSFAISWSACMSSLINVPQPANVAAARIIESYIE